MALTLKESDFKKTVSQYTAKNELIPVIDTFLDDIKNTITELNNMIKEFVDNFYREYPYIWIFQFEKKIDDFDIFDQTNSYFSSYKNAKESYVSNPNKGIIQIESSKIIDSKKSF